VLPLTFLFGFLIGNGLGLMVRAITGVYRLAACTGLAVVAGIANGVAGAPGVGHFLSVVSGIALGAMLGHGAGQFVDLRPGRPTLGGIAAGYARLALAVGRALLRGPTLPNGGGLRPALSGVWSSRGKKVAAVAVWVGAWWLIWGSGSFFWQRQAVWLLPTAFLLGLALYLEGVQSAIVAALPGRSLPPALPSRFDPQTGDDHVPPDGDQESIELSG
jgi:hypothetical protein